MKKVSKKISEIDRNYSQQINVLANELLPSYENFCLREYLKYDGSQEVDDKLVFGAKGKDEKLVDEKLFLVNNFSVSFLIFYLLEKQFRNQQFANCA